MRSSAATRQIRKDVCQECPHKQTQPGGRAEWCSLMSSDVQLPAYRENNESICPDNKWPSLSWKDDLEELKHNIDTDNSIDNFNQALSSINDWNHPLGIKNAARHRLIAYYNMKNK